MQQITIPSNYNEDISHICLISINEFINILEQIIINKCDYIFNL